MDPVLTDGDITHFVVRDEADVAAVRQSIRERAERAGLPRDRAESLIAAASELGHNQIAHAARGEVTVATVHRQGTAGIEVVARDRGRGIGDPTAALRGRPPGVAGPGGGLGVGLGAAYRLADELDFDVRLGEATVITARKFAAPIPRSEVAVLGRPCEGEQVSGDDAFFARRDGGLLLAVADGLGHGPQAQEAAGKAVDVLRGSTAISPLDLVAACQPALAHTRGAVMAVVHVAGDGSGLVQAGVGNIGCHLYQQRSSMRLPSSPGVVGQMGPRARIHPQQARLSSRYVLVMFSDGLSSRIDLSDNADLLREPALVIAHHLLATHGHGHDDALVLVAKG